MFPTGRRTRAVDRLSGAVDGPRTTSPWPVFVALGIALSEVGVVMGGSWLPVAIGGIVLLEGSVVGVLRETGYVDSTSRPTFALGAGFLLIGGLLVRLTSVDVRGTAIAAAGGTAVVASVGLWLHET